MINILIIIQNLLNKILDINNLYNKKNFLIVKKTKISFYGDYQINGLFYFCKLNNIKINYLYSIIKQFLFKKKHIFYKIKLINNYINIFINFLFLNKNLDLFYYNFFINKYNNKINNKKTIIIDYSSPNIAKEMHIGHLRSTIIGDVMFNIFIFLNYKVIRINHIGDWGTQFGLLISFLKKKKKIFYKNKNTISYNKINIQKLSKYYKLAYKEYKINNNFYNSVQYYTLLLQNTNIFNNLWKKIVKITLLENQKIYKLLNLSLKLKHVYGESYYKPLLPFIIKDLKKKKLIKKNNKAFISTLFLKNKKHTLMIQKSNGSFLYSTTDIAALKYRYDHYKPNKIFYFIDSRQKYHIKHIIKLCKKANYIPNSLIVKHKMLGIILNKNNKPFKTRDGYSITLLNVIKFYLTLTKKFFLKKLKTLPKYKINYIINAIAIGSLKYFELSKKRTLDYIFDIKLAISFNGNTALYIQYTYLRIISILRKIKIYNFNYKTILYNNNIDYTQNIKLIIFKLLNFKKIILKVAKKSYPHLLCKYLFDLSKLFNNFYENHSIIKESIYNKKIFYIKIIFIISLIIKIGLKLLGIKLINKL